MKSLFIPLCVVLLLSGCSLFGDSEERSVVTFTTAQQTYARGDTVTARLVNRSDQVVTYNFCFSQLERRVEEGWETVPPSMTCQALGITLEPEEAAPYRLAPGSRFDLSEGTYRIVTGVSYGAQNAEVATNPFRVVE